MTSFRHSDKNIFCCVNPLRFGSHFVTSIIYNILINIIFKNSIGKEVISRYSSIKEANNMLTDWLMRRTKKDTASVQPADEEEKESINEGIEEILQVFLFSSVGHFFLVKHPLVSIGKID